MSAPGEPASGKPAPAAKAGIPADTPGPLLHPFARPATPAGSFIRIVSGQGAHVVDDSGRRYVDGLASLWYCAAGHGREKIIEAVAAQLRKLDAFHLFERFTNIPADALAERLAALAPMPHARVFLTTGGSEAVDTAMKLARLAHTVVGEPERTIIISRSPSYHGVTYGGMSLTGLPANRAGFGPGVADIVQVGKDDLDAVAAVMEREPGRVAAVIAEPVIGAGGVHPPHPGYLAGLRDLCDRHGAFLILDEVITGFGRLGSWFGAGHFGVRPDLLTFAKAVTSGYQPLGGVLLGPAVHEPLGRPDVVLRHGGTYSGHPAACAAALANIAVLEDEGLVGRASEVGARLAAGLRSVAATHGLADVRGYGAMWAVDLPSGLDATDIRNRMLSHGVIVRPIGTSTLAFCPPLVIDLADVDLLSAALAAALDVASQAR
ncbi:aminotransferase class III-fold pyridoxal phosphate-dependent enzyme [Frankia sp. Cppng1_Ct_nod]|uniref:aminotransferase family protein n=1 Tax=Frankia sp. Cppng1_Ct_nod TaxID=2897162 RepID=UPI00104119A4|nr:aminotransferase class III-fold pyridoxal phosphate-dependent enzyme [Frankia sp. Cppng1_Ct_nod]